MSPEERHPGGSRRSIRLKGYDYSLPAAYYVTICIEDRLELLGRMEGTRVMLYAAGEMVRDTWLAMPDFNPGLVLDEFVVMSNHMHVVFGFTSILPATLLVEPKPLSVPLIIRRFKTLTTNKYGDGVREAGWPAYPGRLYQRNYWDRVLRNEQELNNARQYIFDNPAQWEQDELYAKQ